MMVDGRCFGVIAVQDYHNPHAYTDDDMRLMLFRNLPSPPRVRAGSRGRAAATIAEV